jgi:hypothetical protein
MRSFRLLLRPLLAAPGMVVACTFPDVTYGDGGAGETTSSAGTTMATTPTSTCPGLTPCTNAAASCSGTADTTYQSCLAGCHDDMQCTMKCDTNQAADLRACAAACTKCAPMSCNGAQAACQQAAGL